MPVPVKVTISGGRIGTPDPEPVDLKGHGNGEVHIHWNIDPSSDAGWTFTSNGIDISNPSAFQKDGASNNGKKFTWRRKAGSANGTTLIKYTINVTNGSSTLQSDPNIVNQP